jgi:hypothetical protein
MVPEGGEWAMSAPSVKPGDTVRVTVTKVLPFAVLVETAAGQPGLVKHVVAVPRVALSSSHVPHVSWVSDEFGRRIGSALT